MSKKGFTFLRSKKAKPLLKFNNRGFTLIELLVVISVMATMGAFAMVNIGSFRKGQQLQSAVADVQNYLRLAQTNASTNVKCNGVAGVPWAIQFLDNKTINLICSNQTATKTLAGGPTVERVRGTIDCQFPLTVEFAPLYGTVSFIQKPGDSCVSLVTQTITLTIKNDSGIKEIVVSKGGSINAK